MNVNDKFFVIKRFFRTIFFPRGGEHKVYRPGRDGPGGGGGGPPRVQTFFVKLLQRKVVINRQKCFENVFLLV